MSAVPSPVLLRPCRAEDLSAVAAIYGRHVVQGTGTFELEAPSAAEMGRRHDEVRARGLPWIVAEFGGEVLGYAYASPFRARAAYAYALEDSVYVAERAQGRGLGRLLLAELIARCEAAGARQMFALIGDRANQASIALHRRVGFTDAGLMRSAGWKHDRWLDVVIMQRRLGAGDAAPAP